MNWLFYIAGGILWYAFLNGMITSGTDKYSEGLAWLVRFCFIAFWIWVCWRLSGVL